ncbi:DUF6495 family protein [Aureitalea marina]|uniref:Histidyl-tRNA synthetase n=1 Tax=Aureitalea marina TaxID=930804 RepID=A0A2S7KPI9_9FLAO|nr:DUF6495 family protein [Aureitalea marina]PQB04546.1 hypothetical protein BST85_06265 [Aureitalea marina]
MKYTRLTKEQLEELHMEFSRFLAAQSITAQEWEAIKRDKPEVAEQELDVFSDLVWEGVLKAAKFLEHRSNGQLFLFELDTSEIHLIAIRVTNPSVDLTTSTGLDWLGQNLGKEEVQVYRSTKTYGEDPHADVFDLIQKGAVLTSGELYKQLKGIL